MRVACIIPFLASQDMDPLRRAINAARAQADVVVVGLNGGFSDRRKRVSSLLEADYPDKLTVLEQEQPCISRILNTAAEWCVDKGVEYAAVCGADDEWSSAKVATQVAAMDEHGWAASFHAHVFGAEPEVAEMISIDDPVGPDPKYTYKDNVPCASTTMVRTEVFAQCRFDEGLRWAEDWDWHCQVQRKFGWHWVPGIWTVIGREGTHTSGANQRARNMCITTVAGRWRPKGGSEWRK